MENKIIESLFNRKSMRVFRDKEISPQDKELILRAAFQAPTAGCQQLYTILDITDQEKKDKLAVLCDNQPFIAKGKMVLIFLADCRRWLDSYKYANTPARKPEAGDLMLAVADAIIAAQNAVVAAEALGIGSCYIGDILEQHEAVTELLKLDKYTFPATMLVFGYPTAQQLERPKPKRAEGKFIVMENEYRRLSEAEHREMFELQGYLDKGKTFEEYVDAFCRRKYMSDFSAEMSRSANKYLDNFIKGD